MNYTNLTRLQTGLEAYMQKKSLQQPILARWVQEGKWIRFRRRAEEMGIELIENAHLMNDDELLARLKKATE